MTKRSDQDFGRIAEHAPNIIIRFDKKLRHLYVNPAVEAKMGMTPEHMIGKTHQELGIPEEIAGFWTNALKKVFKSAKADLIEFDFMTPAGKVWYRSRLVPEFNKKGTVETVLVIADDITDLKLTQESLQRSEESYRRLFQEDLSGTFVSTPDGKMLMCNPSFARIFGFESVEEVLRSDLIDFYPQKQNRENYLELLREKKKLENFREVLQRKDGSTVYVVSNIRGEFDTDGMLTRIHGYLLDETDRIRGEERLRQSMEQFRKLFEEGPIGMVVIATDLSLIRANAALCNLLGYSEQELKEKGVHGVTHPEDIAIDLDHARRLLNNELPSYQIEKRYVKKTGEILWGLLTASLLRDETGNILYGMGMVEDITGQKVATERLRESEEKYRSLFEDSKDVIFISTPEGKFLDINQAGVELFGYANKAELLAADISRDLYVDAEDRSTMKQLLAERGFLKDHQARVRRKDGKRLTVLETIAVVRNERGEAVTYRGILRDVTEQRGLEEQLRQAQKMESVGTLAGGMAHDFNNILSIILGYVNALEQADLSRDQEVKNIGSIRIAVERGAGIIRQLLTFAKKAAGDITSIRLNETITDLSRLLGETMPKGIDLAFPLTPVNPVLRADENQLQQALLNLCLNAKDAIMSKPDEKGTITIRTDVVQGAALKNRFPRSEGQQYAVIEVQDDGIGMDEEAKGRMFEPFFTTKPPGKGTGLGLAVVYGVVNAHRGFIDVESTAGEGTTVKVYLPAQSWEPASPGDLPRVNDHGGCVLLVEDEEMLLELLKTLLEENGFKVFQARDGEEAVRVYKKHRNEIDVVLSDMGLPKMGGWEAFQKMKEINPDVQSILASGYLDSGLRGEMIKAGAVDFIQKPYIPEIILERIRGIIRSKSG